MVCQAYGGSLPQVQNVAEKAVSRAGFFKAAGVALLSLSALALVVISHQLPSKQPQELLETGLHQHLMSSMSSMDSSDSDSFKHTMSNADDYFQSSDNSQKASKWETQLAALKQRQIARRKKEDAEYFSGVEKAFGKKAGLAMMSAFDGHGKHSATDKMLAKLKVDNSKLAARKAQISHETLTPHPDAAIKKVVDAKNKATAAAAAKMAKTVKKASASKMSAKAAATKENAAAVHKSVVAEALQVAKSMGKHKAPDAAKAKKPEEAKEAVVKDAAKKPEVKKAVDPSHPGVVADSMKIKKLVHEFHHAKGKEKKVLKARVMQLQQQIVNDFKAVTNVGVRASTAFARAEAKEHHK